MYSDLTDAQKADIIREYRGFMYLGTDPNQAAAVAARNVLVKTNRGWGGKKGGNAYAAALTTLVMAGEINLTDAKKADDPAEDPTIHYTDPDGYERTYNSQIQIRDKQYDVLTQVKVARDPEGVRWVVRPISEGVNAEYIQLHQL